VVTVDRSGLTDGNYSTTISVISNVNVVNIPVIMAVGDAFVGNVGRIYVLLLDSATSDVIAWDEVDAAGGIYRYQLLDVPPGDYVIMAGADMDNDLFICDLGEACSLYPTWENPTVVNVDRDITNLDFSVGYILAVPETQSVGPLGEILSPLPTLRPHISAEDRTGVERGHD
jgi:serine protease